MHKLPKQIRIGHLEYDIHLLDEIRNDRGKEVFGQIFYDASRIEISKKHARAIPNTLLHECLHGVLMERGVPHSEKTIEQLANGLIALFKDNPKLLKVIFG